MVPSTILSRRPNFLIRQPFGHLTHDLTLPVCQHRQHVLRVRDVPLLSRYGLIRGGQLAIASGRPRPAATTAPEFRRHILQNDTVGTGLGRYNQFAVFNRCGEKDQARGKTSCCWRWREFPTRSGRD
jgi:hypothetical protein